MLQAKGRSGFQPLPKAFIEKLTRLANHGLPASPKDIAKVLEAYLEAEALLAP